MASSPLRERVAAQGPRRLFWMIPLAVLVLAGVVLAAQGLRDLDAVSDWMTQYPGYVELPAGAPVGVPAWLGWQHFLNGFFLLLIIRSGWLLRTQPKPPATWTRSNLGLVRTKGAPRRMSIYLWMHFSLDALWVLNGVVFIILLAVTGQWMRIVPTDWAVLPNALSAALQYASLDWPTENSWAHYNSLQLLTYFVTVFIAAPLALLTGLRMSPNWPRKARINKVITIDFARKAHFPVMVYFVAFIIVHVTLVFATGALRNLNHMYAAQDGEGWQGFWIFAASLVVMIVAWVLVRPPVLRRIAALSGTVG